MATTQGFPAWKDRIAAKDDRTTAAIRRRRVIVGKTNIPELPQGWPAATACSAPPNAYDPERSSLARPAARASRRRRRWCRSRPA
jgi:Asp-tRNA(Asn)/Glu-tRNA(Gln) amidotransferase A subunit family amidase